MMTPRLTEHARERCLQYGVRTKTVKDLVRAPDLTRPCRGGLMLAVQDGVPWAAVFAPGVRPEVVTVVPRTYEDWDYADYTI